MLAPLCPVPCTLKVRVTHIKCATRTQEASAQLPSALQPNAAIAAPSAMRAKHKSDSHQARQPHNAMEASTQLPSALQPNAAVATPSAMRAQHERDSRRVRQPHKRRSQCPAALSAMHVQCHARLA